jgi:hypothetical protein
MSRRHLPDPEPTSAGRKLRELVYNNFILEDHALHVFVLGGPDFIVGPEAPPELRNIVGVIQKVGLEAGKKVIGTRRRLRELTTYLGGKVVHPVLGLPGGVAKAMKPADLPKFQELCRDAVEFSTWSLEVLKGDVAGQPGLCGDDQVRRVHPPDLLHGDGGRAEQGQLLRRQTARGRLQRQGSLQVHRRSNTAIMWPSMSSRGAT